MKTILSLFVFSFFLYGVQARTWTAASGSTLDAEFVKEAYGNVYLKKTNGKMAKVPFAKLSLEDQKYLIESGKVYNVALKQQYAASAKANTAATLTDYVKDLFEGGQLTDHKGKKLEASTLGGKKKIAYYFSASWCPPCRAFTPKLIDAYNQYNNGGDGDLEIILVGSDRDKKSHLGYLKKMPWLSVEYGGDAHNKIKSSFQVRGIPTLIVVNENGEVLSANARGAVGQKGAKAFESL